MPEAQKQSRDPDKTKARILAAATVEFAKMGLGGARVDVIAARAKVQKRMMYHYFGKKDALYLVVLEEAYAKFRAAEAALELAQHEPKIALQKLVEFTWAYYLANPDFISLVNTENLHHAKYLKTSQQLSSLNKSFVARMEDLLQRGAKAGQFREGLDAVQVLISLAGIGYHYITNQFTGEIVYGRALMSKEAQAARLKFNIECMMRIICVRERE